METDIRSSLVNLINFLQLQYIQALATIVSGKPSVSTSQGNLVDIRNTLLGQFRDFIPSRLLKDSHSLLSTILNVNPTCKQDIVNEMVGQICTFIKNTYEVE